MKILGYMLIALVLLTFGYNIFVADSNAQQIKDHPIASGVFGNNLLEGTTFGLSPGAFLIVAGTALVGGILMVVKAKD